MASPRFIHVGFNFTGVAPIAELEKVFGSSIDWLRYENHCWLLYSTTELSIWRDRIHNCPGILPADSFFLSEFSESSYTGYMHKWVWDWLSKSR
jgi:hypothetical protein